MTTSQSDAPWLTQEAYDRLSKELEYISGPGRQEIIERIEAARDEGDLKENGGYHAAKEEQGKMEGRIAQLTTLLQNAEVGEEPPADDGVVEPGMIVTIEMFGETETFLFGNREIAADDESLEVYSERSPLGKAIDGRSQGETIGYEAPNGKKIDVKIVEVRPYEG